MRRPTKNEAEQTTKTPVIMSARQSIPHTKHFFSSGGGIGFGHESSQSEHPQAGA